MERPRTLVSVLTIVVALGLTVFAVAAVAVPSLVQHLPWAGAAAGLVALLQAVGLRAAAPGVRWVLAGAGAATIVMMGVVALLR